MKKSSEELQVGTIVGNPALDHGCRILTHSPALHRFLQHPSFLGHVTEWIGTSLACRHRERHRPARIPHSLLVRHMLVCGATGSGKSRFLLQLCRLLVERQFSLVLIDPKGETADHLLAWLVADGFHPEQVVVLDPRQEEGVPGLNPFLADVPTVQAVGDLVALVKAGSSTWGPRLEDVLTNACLIVACLRLSIDELVRFLTTPTYRAALLRRRLPPGAPAWLVEAWSYFEHEFGCWSASEQASATSPVTNKLRALLRSPFLRALTCARENTLQLTDLWRQPGLVLVRLDRVALGEEASRWLAGLLTNLLLRTALRSRGPVPVVLALDELPVVEHFVGAAIQQIVTVARSQGLACLAACQHLSQLSDALQATLLNNTAVQAFFRVGPRDAHLVANALAVGTEARVTRVVADLASVDRVTGQPERTERAHRILDAYGRPLRLSGAAWQCLGREQQRGPAALAYLLQEARAIPPGRLYVQSPVTDEPVELRAYVAGLRPEDYYLAGPAPLQLVVLFPKPRLSGIERASEAEASRTWTRCLLDLPVQHAVLRLAGEPAQVIRVADVPTPAVDRAQLKRFLAACRAVNGQSAAEIEAARHWRAAQIERLARGHAGPLEEVDDESL